MSSLQHITVNGTTYEFADETKASKSGDTFTGGVTFNKQVHHYITGSGTAGTNGSSSAAYVPAKWTFNLGLTPSAGDIITVKAPVAGVNAGIWISVNNGTTYYPIATNGESMLQTQFAVNSPLLLIYETGFSTKMYGNTVSGGAKGASLTSYSTDRWRVLNFYDSNTTYSPASLGFGYGTCATAEATAAKVVTLSSYALVTGGIVSVKFTYAVPASATMNINSKGAKSIYYKGAAITAGVINAGDVATFIYSSQYHLIAIDRAQRSNNANVSWDSTNKKLTKTIDGTTSDVVTAATLKTAMSLAKGDVGLGNVENKSSATIRGELTSSNVTTALGYTPLDASKKGAASGVAELGTDGKVPSSQLPSYVDDVLEYASQSNFPATGETGKIYIAQDTNKTYRWSGSAYTEISASLALGETSSTAYRGDRGKTAYTHATDSSRLTTAQSSGLYKIATTAEGHIASVTAVAKADITGLGIPGSDTNTHRPIQVNGTEVLGNNTTALNLKAGSNVSVTNSSGTVTIAATDTTYSSKDAASGGTDVSLVTTGEKYTWNSKTSNTGTVTKVSTGAGLTGGDVTTTGTIKANLTSETNLTNAAADGTETAGKVYPVRLDKNGKLAVNVPWSDNNTHRPIQVNGTEVLGNNTTALNLKAGSNVSVTNSSGTVTIAATDTTYSDATQSTHGLMSTADKAKLDGLGTAANATIANNFTTTTEGYVADARTVKELNSKKIDKPVSVAAGKFFQTDSNGDAIWGNAASPTDVANAVTDWLDDKIPTGQTVVVDRSLTINGAAADAKVVGGLKSAIDFVTILEKSQTGGYIDNADPKNVLSPAPAIGTYAGKFVWDRCNPGDVYTVTLSALSGIYPWVICSANGTILEHGTKSQGETNKDITIPENSAFFGANCYGSNDSVVKTVGIPRYNKDNANTIIKNVPFEYVHKYFNTTSPFDVTNPGVYSASYAGGIIWDKCKQGDIYILENVHLVITIGYIITICNEEGTIIAHSTLVGNANDFDYKNFYVEIPENGAYIGIQCNDNVSKVSKIIPISEELDGMNENPFKGLKGVAFGTSLTSMADISGKYGYLSTLRNILECTIDDQGVGGSYWFLVDRSNSSVTHVVENYSGYSDKDFVIIEGCINDWFTSKGLGTYTDDAYTSVCGCLRKMINHIYTQKPTAQIYVILDHQGRDYGGNDCSATAVVNGKTQYEYYSELKKVCELYSIPVICEFMESNIGMYGTEYLADNIHCNELGAKQSGQYIAKKMKQFGIKEK